MWGTLFSGKPIYGKQHRKKTQTTWKRSLATWIWKTLANNHDFFSTDNHLHMMGVSMYRLSKAPHTP
jgi:hypothetical protein